MISGYNLETKNKSSTQQNIFKKLNNYYTQGRNGSFSLVSACFLSCTLSIHASVKSGYLVYILFSCVLYPERFWKTTTFKCLINSLSFFFRSSLIHYIPPAVSPPSFPIHSLQMLSSFIFFKKANSPRDTQTWSKKLK